MLDLFKKEEINSLKAKITELKEENTRLSLLLSKKDEKTKKTIAFKQEVDRELNEARQKISSLENEVQKLKKDTSCELNFRFSESLPRHKLDEILFLLNSLQSKTSSLITIYLAKNETLNDATKDLAAQIDNNALYLIEKIESSTGKAIFYDINRIVMLVMIPVFPILHSEYVLDRRFNIEPLKNSLESDRTLVINAHAGETFIGIIEAETFVEHEVIRSSVMGKHSKGGWSQKRFQSLIEGDIKHHADKVRTVLDPMVDKYKEIRYVIAGGEGKLIKMIMEGYNYPLVIKSMDAQALNAQELLKEVMAVRWYGI